MEEYIMTVYKTRGVCSRSIEIELDGDTIASVKFNGGCNGNTKGIASLVKGMKVNEVIERLKGNRLRRTRHFLPGSACTGSGIHQGTECVN